MTIGMIETAKIGGWIMEDKKVKGDVRTFKICKDGKRYDTIFFYNCKLTTKEIKEKLLKEDSLYEMLGDSLTVREIKK